MNVGKRLEEIWNEEYITTLPSIVKERGYIYADNVQSDILITGINPSFREADKEGVFHGPIKNRWFDDKHDNYWSPIKNILHNENLDLRNETDYLDIFYFREQDQRFLNEQILSSPNGIKFVVDQLNLTMHILEDIVIPKLIVVKNKESWAYFGKLYDEKGWVWMGYKFEHISNLLCGELCRITGLLESNERIAPEIQQSKLIGSFVLFTKHINQYTAINDRPTPQILQSILNWYDSERYIKNISI
jgi:hypothetical protein